MGTDSTAVAGRRESVSDRSRGREQLIAPELDLLGEIEVESNQFVKLCGVRRNQVLQILLFFGIDLHSVAGGQSHGGWGSLQGSPKGRANPV